MVENLIEQIVHALHNAISADPGQEYAWRLLGSVLAYGPCRAAEGAAAYEHGLSLRKRYDGTGWEWFELAKIYHFKLNAHERAEKSLLKAIEIDGEEPIYLDLFEVVQKAVRLGSSTTGEQSASA